MLIGEDAPDPEVPSDPVTVKVDIALPPFAGAVNAILLALTPAVAVGALICAGTVVERTDEETVPFDDPAAFLATTVTV